MPVQLRPISRRRFIGVTGASALLLSSGLAGTRNSVDPDSFVLFSDTHISGDKAAVSRNVNMADHLETAVREVRALQKAPGAVFLCGDCAFGSGRNEDYQVLTGLLEPLREDGLPIYLALGNHDHRAHFEAAMPGPHRSQRRAVPDKLVLLVRTDKVNWFVLDSLEITESTPGLLGADQLAWLAGTLDANTDKPAIVMVHHNPGLSGNLGLKDTLALMEIIRPRTHVKAYIYGHTHSWSTTKDESGLHLINLPAVGYVFRDADPSGWVHAQVQRNGMQIKFHGLGKPNAAHGQELTFAWR